MVVNKIKYLQMQYFLGTIGIVLIGGIIMENISQMSMLEVACLLMEQKRNCQPIRKLIKEVLEMKSIDDQNGEFAAQLYVDITTSSKFVYMGNEEWDLKSRQSLDEWDKDGSAFNTKEDLDEEEIASVLPVDDFIIDSAVAEEEDDEEVEVVEEEDEDEDDSIIETVPYVDDALDDDEEEEFMDEDKYNDYMDDFENMYDED